MTIKIAVLISYFVIVLVIGFIARTRWKSTPETYFLADRKLGPMILMEIMVATNFSAFMVFGTSGAGYRDGYAFFPIMLWREKSLQIYLPQWIYNPYVWILMGVFILAMDFWAWNKIGMLFWGIPRWVGYFVVLSTLQTIAMVYIVRKDD